jgi:hypothetical protein
MVREATAGTPPTTECMFALGGMQGTDACTGEQAGSSAGAAGSSLQTTGAVSRCPVLASNGIKAGGELATCSPGRMCSSGNVVAVMAEQGRGPCMSMGTAGTSCRARDTAPDGDCARACKLAESSLDMLRARPPNCRSGNIRCGQICKQEQAGARTQRPPTRSHAVF